MKTNDNPMVKYFGEWFQFINPDIISSLMGKLENLYTSFSISCKPAKNMVFRAFNETPYDKLKVVIIGQDPYKEGNTATGLAFANSEDKAELSPSLYIIKQALIDPMHSYYPSRKFDQTLKSWADQGVLLLNSALTASPGEDDWHANTWRPFISTFLENLSTANPGIIYILFGEAAKTFRPYIKRGHVLIEKHPSYFARTHQYMTSRVFDEANQILKFTNNDNIDWYETIEIKS